MSRNNFFTSPRSHVPSGTSTDYQVLLRADEVSGVMLDDLGGASFTLLGAPGTTGSATRDNLVNGARVFNGTTQAAVRSTIVSTDADNFHVENGGFGVACWCRPNTIRDQTVFELADYHAAADETRNAQFRLRPRASGAFSSEFEEGAGSTGRRDSTGNGLMQAGVWSHIGVCFRPDPDKINRANVQLFFNGKMVAQAFDRPWPTGGSNARWIVGASRGLGTGLGVPGEFFDGALDDLIVTRWPPDVAWFRSVYGRGVQDFEKRFQNSNGNKRAMFSTFCRVLVKAPTGKYARLRRVDLDWVDLTNVNGIDFVKDVSWGASLDDFIMGATVSLHPRYSAYNLSPFVPELIDMGGTVMNPNPFGEPVVAAVDSPLNAFLRSMRRVRIETAMCPMGMSREQADPYWEVAFDGLLRAVDVADDEVTMTCADLGSGLLDAFVEPTSDGTDRQYGTAGGTPIEGELQDLIDDNSPGRFEIVPSISGSVAGIDDSGLGGRIVIQLFSNTLTADINARGRPHCFQAGDLISVSGTVNYNGTYTVFSTTDLAITTVETKSGTGAENAGFVTAVDSFAYGKIGVPKLFVPTTPAWNVYEWNEPASKGVLQALDDIASQIGWRVAYKWHDLRQEFRLTLFSGPAPFLVYVQDVLSIGRMSIKIDDARNVIVGEYASEATKDAVGERAIYARAVRDILSLRTYGRFMARIRVDGDSLVNNSGEMDELISTVLNDLSQPIAETDVETLYNPLVETGDWLVFAGQQGSLGVVGDDGFLPQMLLTDHTGAVASFEHTHSNDETRTTHRLRRVVANTGIYGTASRVDRHQESFAQRGSTRGRGLSPPKTPAAPTIRVLGNLNGNRMVTASWAMPVSGLNQAWRSTEVHLSTTTGFTPSSASLVGVVSGTTHTFLTPSASTTYYCRLVHRDLMRNRSAPGPQTSFVSAA